MRLKFFAAISLLIILFPCCKLIGLHFDVENPKKPGVYPELTKAQKILAQKTIKRTCFDVKSPLQAMNSGISTLYCLKLLISLVFIM